VWVWVRVQEQRWQHAAGVGRLVALQVVVATVHARPAPAVPHRRRYQPARAPPPPPDTEMTTCEALVGTTSVPLPAV